MAIDLVAKLRLQDDLTRPLKKVMRQLNSAGKSTEKMAKSTDKLGKTTNRAASVTDKLGNAFKSASGKANGLSSSISKVSSGTNALNSLRNTVLGIATAFLTAQGAAKALDATIGAAARFEQSEVAVKAIFADDAAASSYIKMLEDMALKSPLLNSNDMMASSKSLVSMTKNVDDLARAWSVIERLMVLDPTQGTDGAAFALKEMWQGDSLSMVERFGLDKAELNRIKKLGISEQLTEIDKLLGKMQITQSVVDEMGGTTAGLWSQLTEKAEVFFREVGKLSNTKLGDVLRQINDMIEGMDAAKFSNALGELLGGAVDKAITFGKWLWKWREPIIAVTKVVGVFAATLGSILAISGTIAGIGAAISFLTSPIGYIAVGVTAAVVAFKALYDHSERFRSAITGIMSKVKSLWGVFKEGGAKGLIEALIPADILSALGARFATLKETFIDTFKAIYNAVVPILQTAWSLVQPILSALGNALKIVADVAMIAWNNILAPAIQFVMAAIQTMWKITGPIFKLLGAVIKAAFAVLRVAWDTIIGPFVTFLAGAFTHAFGAATEIIKALSPVFETLGGWIKTAADYLSMFADWLGKIKVPDWIGNLSGGAVSWAKKLIPGNYHGLDSVPYDGYVTRLHKNEMVLNAQEAKAYREGRGGISGGINITMNGVTIREEADVEKFAYKLAKYIEREASQIG